MRWTARAGSRFLLAGIFLGRGGLHFIQIKPDSLLLIRAGLPEGMRLTHLVAIVVALSIILHSLPTWSWRDSSNRNRKPKNPHGVESDW